MITHLVNKIEYFSKATCCICCICTISMELKTALNTGIHRRFLLSVSSIAIKTKIYNVSNTRNRKRHVSGMTNVSEVGGCCENGRNVERISDDWTIARSCACSEENYVCSVCYQPGRCPYAGGPVPGDRDDGTVGEGRHRSHVRGVTGQHAAQLVRYKLVHRDVRDVVGEVLRSITRDSLTHGPTHVPHKAHRARLCALPRAAISVDQR